LGRLSDLFPLRLLWGFVIVLYWLAGCKLVPRLAFDAVHTFGHFVRPSHVVFLHPINTELLMSDLIFVLF
jgi:hypothetical protein